MFAHSYWPLLLKLCKIQWKCLSMAVCGMKSTHTLSLEQMTNVMPLSERFNLLANFTSNKILSNASHSALPSIYDPLSLNIPLPVLKIFTDKRNNYNILRTGIHTLFKISFASHYFQPVLKFLRAREPAVTPGEV